METNPLDPNKFRKLHISIIVLLENWMVEEAIELAIKVLGMIAPESATDLLRCLVGAEDNLPMSDDELFELRKIALDLAEEYRESQVSQTQEVQS